jgi:DNA adenine methylase
MTQSRENTMQLSFIEDYKPSKVVNVSSVPQRSPFRYPGGKTWLVPTVRQWLRYVNGITNDLSLIEPFCGGGIISLTAAFEDLARNVLMVEFDEEIAAVWQTILSDDNHWLTESILKFDLTAENALSVINKENKQIRDKALSTILKNRLYHGGIICKGSSFLKKGENGKGIASRWYPETLSNRMKAILAVQDKITFQQGDAFQCLEENSERNDVAYFIDPPYTIAGKRLYTHYNLDHRKLFEVSSTLMGQVLMTYDDTEEIRGYAKEYGFDFVSIPMKTTHHKQKYELLISKDLSWFKA